MPQVGHLSIQHLLNIDQYLLNIDHVSVTVLGVGDSGEQDINIAVLEITF